MNRIYELEVAGVIADLPNTISSNLKINSQLATEKEIYAACRLFTPGFIIMLTLSFSVKERIAEIGIRRVLGAGETDIMLQFMLEGIVISITSCFINMICCFVLYSIFSAIMLKFFFTAFLIKLHLRTIMLSFFISIIEGIVFSVVPALHASRIKPVDAIRFD